MFSTKNIETSFLSSQLIFIHLFENKSEFPSHFFSISVFFFWVHFIEDYSTISLEKRHWPCQDISHIGCRSRHHTIIFSSVLWIFCEYFCAFLYRYNILESKFLNKMIHCFDFFPHTIEKCHPERWLSYFERNTRKSPARSDIEYFSFEFYRSQDSKRINKMFDNNTLFISNCGEICMRIIGNKKTEKCLKKLFFWERKCDSVWEKK